MDGVVAPAPSRRFLAFVAVAGAITGCYGPSATVALPSAPSLPAGWIVTETRTRDLRLALPPDVRPSQADEQIMANEPPPPGALVWFEVQATPARSLADQPSGDVADWLVEYIRQGTPATILAKESVVLPAGPAQRLRIAFSPGRPEETYVTAYAIRTADGYAVLRIAGPKATLERRAGDVSLIANLISFAPKTGG
jgi:hypothetical protein